VDSDQARRHMAQVDQSLAVKCHTSSTDLKHKCTAATTVTSMISPHQLTESAQITHKHTANCPFNPLMPTVVIYVILYIMCIL